MFLGCPLHALKENISGTPLSPVVLGEQMASQQRKRRERWTPYLTFGQIQ